MEAENSLKFYLNTVEEEGGIIRIDVKADNVPANLFGVSFYLKIDGVDWQLENYSLGDVFNGGTPLLLVKEKHDQSNVIVVGESMKRDDDYAGKDGVLMTFYVKTLNSGEIVMSFDNGVAAIFDGERVDVSNVDWVGDRIDIKSESVSKSLETSKIELVEVSLKDAEVNLLGGVKNAEYNIVDIYVVLAVSFIVLMFVYVVFLIVKRGKINL